MRRVRRTAVVCAAIAAISFGIPVQAALITGDAADSELGGDNALGDGGGTPAGTITSNINNGNIRIGSGGSGSVVGNFAAVVVLDLPALISGETFDTASLRINLAAKEGTVTSFQADLYAIGARSANTVLSPGDFYIGAFGGDTTSATPLHDNLLASGTANGLITTSGGVGTGANTLVSYLNDLYATDPTAGDKFLFLRINPDADPPSGASNRYRVTPANDATVANHPTLIYTTVPEPGTAGLLMAAGLLAASRRRRRD